MLSAIVKVAKFGLLCGPSEDFCCGGGGGGGGGVRPVMNGGSITTE
jgi:hypothetical protein